MNGARSLKLLQLESVSELPGKQAVTQIPGPRSQFESLRLVQPENWHSAQGFRLCQCNQPVGHVLSQPWATPSSQSPNFPGLQFPPVWNDHVRMPVS